MRHVLATSGLRGGTTVPEWGRQLRLLQEVQDSLTRFTPDIYDRPVTDLVAATAGAAWRREHGIEMTGLQRSRLRKAAKEYIRHGVHLSDLHSALVRVQSERERWREWATSSVSPTVSERVEELAAVHARFVEDLEGLAIALEGSPAGADLLGRPIEHLRGILDGLINDEENLEMLPERTVLLDELRGQGLGELLDDLVRRTVAREQVPGEFDLAWWQSTLGAMITGDDFLAMPEGHTLRKAESTFRRADAAHVASGADRLLWDLADRWQRTVRRSPRAGAALRRMLRAGAAPARGGQRLRRRADRLAGARVDGQSARALGGAARGARLRRRGGARRRELPARGGAAGADPVPPGDRVRRPAPGPSPALHGGAHRGARPGGATGGRGGQRLRRPLPRGAGADAADGLPVDGRAGLPLPERAVLRRAAPAPAARRVRHRSHPGALRRVRPRRRGSPHRGDRGHPGPRRRGPPRRGARVRARGAPPAPFPGRGDGQPGARHPDRRGRPAADAGGAGRRGVLRPRAGVLPGGGPAPGRRHRAGHRDLLPGLRQDGQRPHRAVPGGPVRAARAAVLRAGHDPGPATPPGS
jgi:hypothetical protein